MSNHTKQDIADAFKRLLAHMPLDKVTVTALAEESGITRQTFYYHFSDLYDLISWIYSTESERVLGSERTYDTWQMGLLAIMDWLLQSRNFVIRTIHSVDAAYAQRYLNDRVRGLVYGVVSEEAAGHRVSQQDQAFIASFYAAGLITVVMGWIDEGMRENPSAVVEKVSLTVYGDIPAAVARFEAAGR